MVSTIAESTKKMANIYAIGVWAIAVIERCGMTSEEAIEELKRDIHNAKVTHHLSEHYEMAIKALEQEPCEDCIKIPEGATNGEVIEKVFPQLKGKIFSNNGFSYDIENDDGQVMVKCDGEWWNSPYRKEQE